MKKGSAVLSLVCVLLCLLGIGCGGGSSSSTGNNGGGGGTPPSGLQFTSPTTPQTLEVGQTNPTIFVKVSQPVVWSLQNGSCPKTMPAGILTNLTDTTATYNGPTQPVNTSCPTNPNPPANPIDLIVATSKSSSTQSTSLNVVIVQTPPCIGSNKATCGLNGISYMGTGNDGCTAGVPCCPQSGTLVSQAKTTVGVPYLQVLYAGFGIPPYTWKVVNGSLPVGVLLAPGSDSSTMVAMGTPVSPGCSSIELQVTDSKGVSSTPAGGQPETAYLVTLPPSLKVQIPSYPLAYNQTLAAGDPGVPYLPTPLVANSGVGPYTWTPDTSNVPPMGLTFTSSPTNTSVVALSGTPVPGAETGGSGGQSGQYPVTVNVNDNQRPYPAVGTVTLSNMGDAPLTQFCSAASPLPPTATNGGTSAGGPVPGNSFLNGSFAFLLRGSDANGPVVIAGHVALDGTGKVSGVEDVTRSSGSQSFTVDPANSSYTVGTNDSRPLSSGGSQALYNRGCMTLATQGGPTTAFALSLGSCSNGFSENGTINSFKDACGMTQNNALNVAAGTFTTGRIIEFDDNTGNGTRATGILRMQDTSSFSTGLNGRYAFGLAGWDFGKGHYALAGSMMAGSGNFSSAAADVDDAGTLASQLTGGSGTYVLDGTTGRGTGTLKVGQQSLDLALYQVSKNETFLITTDPISASHPVLGGEAILTTNSFSSQSLQHSHMFHIGGLSATGPDVTVGILNFDGIGSFTGTSFEDQAATVSTNSLSGAFAVDPVTGRTTFTAPLIGQNLGAHPWIAYIVPPASTLNRFSCSQPGNCITGFLVGTDDTAQDGLMEFQLPVNAPPPPFTNRYIAGDYVIGNDESLDPPSTPNKSVSITGDVFANPSSSSSTSGSLGGPLVPYFQDVNYGDPNYCVLPGTSPGPEPCLLLFPGLALTGSYSIASNGTGTFGGGTASVSNGNTIFYIDESPLNLHPSVLVAEQ